MEKRMVVGGFTVAVMLGLQGCASIPGKSGRAFFLFGSHGLPFLVHWVRLFFITLIAWRWQVGTGAA
jgi:hypothetical protein